MAAKLNLVGQRFDRLVVISEDRNGKGVLVWKCKCDCGQIISVVTGHLRTGRTKSCGCLRKEKIPIGMGLKHGHHKHDYMSSTYVTWLAMKRRCSDPKHKNYKNYGGKGMNETS